MVRTYKIMMLMEVITPNSRSIWFGTNIKAAKPNAVAALVMSDANPMR